MIAALRRQLDEMKQIIAAKDRELRKMQREIDQFYGKLAAGNQLVDLEVHQSPTAAITRLASHEEREATEGKCYQPHQK